MASIKVEGEVREISVVGSSKNSDISPFEVSIISNDSKSIVRFNAVENTISERSHPMNGGNPMIEINVTVFATNLFTEENFGFPYGSNPRLPVLCSTFTDIYNTVVSPDSYLNFISYNTGIDIMAEEISVSGDEVTVTFDGPRDGIANGGLTYSVLQYASQQGLLPEDLRVSVRLWSREGQSHSEQTKVADKRNSHRPLIGIDKLNQMHAFQQMKETLDEAYAQRVVWHTGDQDVDQTANISVEDLCRTLYAFQMKSGGKSNERHPTMNVKDSEGIESVYETIELKGTITAPSTGAELMWEAIGGEH